jgi:hypothetical protein
MPKGREMSDQISRPTAVLTTDRLPDVNAEVIAYGDSPKFVFNAKFDGNTWWRSNSGYGFTVGAGKVVWWMPMPDIPM